MPRLTTCNQCSRGATYKVTVILPRRVGQIVEYARCDWHQDQAEIEKIERFVEWLKLVSLPTVKEN